MSKKLIEKLNNLDCDFTKKIISVVGATCTGKTNLSIALAEHLGLEIINADSRLIFEGMNIGTAKPSLEERRGIKHHLIDIRKPDQIYSSGEYRRDFDKLLEGRDDRFVVVGGTGMYLRAALENLDMPEISTDVEMRAELEQKDLTELCAELKELDPEACEIVDTQNIRRVSRALEIIKLSGKKFSELRQKHENDRYEVSAIGISFDDRELLYDLINKRVHKMIEMGLVDEVQSLVNQYGKPKTLTNTIGYGEIIQYLNKDLSLDEAIALIQKKTRNYAKRQITWFKSNPRIQWLSAEELFGL